MYRLRHGPVGIMDDASEISVGYDGARTRRVPRESAGAPAEPPRDAARFQSGAGALNQRRTECSGGESRQAAEHKALEKYFQKLARRYTEDERARQLGADLPWHEHRAGVSVERPVLRTNHVRRHLTRFTLHHRLSPRLRDHRDLHATPFGCTEHSHTDRLA